MVQSLGRLVNLSSIHSFRLGSCCFADRFFSYIESTAVQHTLESANSKTVVFAVLTLLLGCVVLSSQNQKIG